jgi:DNA segregation ATPase FtsK/SpoIIIE-like protein
MALRDILDRQANTIEYVLHTHGINASIDGGKLSPRLAHFHLVLPPGVRPAQLSPLVPELSEALGVAACRLAPGGGDGVYVEVPRPDPVPVRLLSLVQRVADVVPPTTATLGLDTDATPLLLRLNAADVDPVLVTGNPGSGKSRLLRGIALSLALHNSPDRLKLLLLDASGEGTAFRGLETLPHLACPVAVGAVDAVVSLRWALRALARRDASAPRPDHEDGDELFFEDEPVYPPSGERGYGGPDEEPALVALVDGAEMLAAGPNGRANTEAMQALSRLASLGNKHGIHLVVASERPDIDLNADWGARITGTILSSEMARIATGMKGSGAHGLLGSGDFLISLNAELIRFQAAGASSADVARAADLITNWAASQLTGPAARQPRSAAEPDTSGRRIHGEAPPALPGRPHAPRRDDEQALEPVPLHRVWAGD